MPVRAAFGTAQVGDARCLCAEGDDGGVGVGVAEAQAKAGAFQCRTVVRVLSQRRRKRVGDGDPYRIGRQVNRPAQRLGDESCLRIGLADVLHKQDRRLQRLLSAVLGRRNLWLPVWRWTQAEQGKKNQGAGCPGHHASGPWPGTHRSACSLVAEGIGGSAHGQLLRFPEKTDGSHARGRTTVLHRRMPSQAINASGPATEVSTGIRISSRSAQRIEPSGPAGCSAATSGPHMRLRAKDGRPRHGSSFTPTRSWRSPRRAPRSGPG